MKFNLHLDGSLLFTMYMHMNIHMHKHMHVRKYMYIHMYIYNVNVYAHVNDSDVKIKTNEELTYPEFKIYCFMENPSKNKLKVLIRTLMMMATDPVLIAEGWRPWMHSPALSLTPLSCGGYTLLQGSASPVIDVVGPRSSLSSSQPFPINSALEDVDAEVLCPDDMAEVL